MKLGKQGNAEMCMWTNAHPASCRNISSLSSSFDKCSLAESDLLLADPLPPSSGAEGEACACLALSSHLPQVGTSSPPSSSSETVPSLDSGLPHSLHTGAFRALDFEFLTLWCFGIHFGLTPDGRSFCMASDHSIFTLVWICKFGIHNIRRLKAEAREACAIWALESYSEFEKQVHPGEVTVNKLSGIVGVETDKVNQPHSTEAILSTGVM